MEKYTYGNGYKIPTLLLEKIKRKYKKCVYCRKKLRKLLHSIGTPHNKATVEHMDNESLKHPTEKNVTMCCGSCNSSRGQKTLVRWFKSEYCKKKNINKSTVSKIVLTCWIKELRKK